MKIKTKLLGSALAFTLAWSLLPAATAAEKGSARGGASDLALKAITTPAEADALKPGDEMAMICAKCKSVVVHRVTTEKGHIKTMTVGEKHACPGCESTIEVTGFGKGKRDQLKHVCGKCGDDSAFCCATKPGAGRGTAGMEK
jgi:hypothetical protein